jgi:hypothetical protein
VHIAQLLTLFTEIDCFCNTIVSYVCTYFGMMLCAVLDGCKTMKDILSLSCNGCVYEYFSVMLLVLLKKLIMIVSIVYLIYLFNSPKFMSCCVTRQVKQVDTYCGCLIYSVDSPELVSCYLPISVCKIKTHLSPFLATVN